MWLGTSATTLLQVKDNIDTNTTYTLVKSGSSIQLKNQSGTVVSTVTDSNTTYSAATQSAAGLMSADDKKRLDGMEDGAQANQLAFSTITVGNTSLAADSETGTLGLVAGNNVSLSPDADNMRVTISATDTTYSDASQTTHGLMSVDDKKKLDGIATGANKTVVDSALSSTSTNPVQNKVINAALAGKAASSHNHDAASITSGQLALDRIPNVNDKVTEVAASKITGTIAAVNLPSYVDDVLEYDSLSKFPTTGEAGKIYTATDTNKIYRWSGSAYVVISDTIALGTTHASAGYGDESRAAYTHAVTNKGAAFASGLYKITTNVEGHVTAATNVAKSDITGLGIPAQDTWTALKGATTSAAGTAGYAPAPSAGASNRYLRSDGTWSVPPDNNTTYSNATQSAAGLMSVDDKKKLDGIASGANNYSLPTATSSVLGGVKVGSNITNSSGTISVTKDNVVAALGYTPPTTNTTYAALTNDEIDAAWTAVFG